MKALLCRRLLFSLLAVLSFSSCGPAGEGEMHLLQPEFVGPVVIIFNQPDGAPREYQGGKRIYRIPSSGVLRTQFPTPRSGVVKIHFYYAVNDSVVAELRELIGSEEASAGTGTYVFEEEIGGVSRSPPEPHLDYMSYVVGHVADGDSLAREATRLVGRETRDTTR